MHPASRKCLRFAYSSVLTADDSISTLGQVEIALDSGQSWIDAPAGWNFSVGRNANLTKMDQISIPHHSTSGNSSKDLDFKRNGDGSWSLIPLDDASRRPILAWDQLASDSIGNRSTDFTVKAVVPCDKPVAKECNAQEFGLTVDQWNAFSTDDFVTASLKNYTNQHPADKGYFDWFKDTYMGDSFSYVCQVDSKEACGM